MENPVGVGLILIGIGLLTVIGSALNWRIITRSGKLFNRILGDTGARVLYGLVGIAFIVLGIAKLVGLNWL